MSLTETPVETFNEMMSAYSIDGVVNDFFTSMLKDPSITKLTHSKNFRNPPNSSSQNQKESQPADQNLNASQQRVFQKNEDKNGENLKRFLFYLCSMCTNEKRFFNTMNSHRSKFTNDSNKQNAIDKHIDQFKNSNFDSEVIHSIVKLRGCIDDDILATMMPMHTSSSETRGKIGNYYEKMFDVVSLRRKYYPYFNPFYYASYDEFSRSIEKYDRRFKKKYLQKALLKTTDTDPINPSKSQLKYFLDMIKLNLLKTDLIQFLINIFENKENALHNDPETEFIAGQLLYILLLFIVELK